MTDEAMRAKNWLNRSYDLYRRLNSDRKLLEVIEARLNPAVASYKVRDNETDSETARKNHEAIQDEYTIQKKLVEAEETVLTFEDDKTKRKIDLLPEPHRSIATRRYLNRLKWSEIAIVENYSEQHCKRLNKEMLQLMAEILRKGTNFEEVENEEAGM